MPGEVVDAHVHFWRRSDLPWLNGPAVPRIFGDYEALRRDFPVDEYTAAAIPAGVRAAVYVQANWPSERVVDEVARLAELHEAHGWPHAIVAAADLFDERAAVVIERQLERSSLVRGHRVQLHWHADERLRFASAPDRVLDPVLRRNVALLGELGLLFELQVFPGQMAHAAELVAQTPGTTFVLVHAGMPQSTAARHLEPWLSGLELLAPLPNLFVKLSGQGTFVRRIDEELIGLVATTAVERFGARRCMFGSNFPIESMWTDYASLLGAWRDALDPAVHDDVLAATARRVYGLAR